MGHHIQPGVLLAYAQTLYVTEAVPPAWLVTVPGIRFGYGEFISDVALSAIREALDDEGSQLRRLVANLSLAACIPKPTTNGKDRS
jgi:hypothetical protein